MLLCIGDTHHKDLAGQDSSPLLTWRMIRQGVCRVKTVECVGTVMRLGDRVVVEQWSGLTTRGTFFLWSCSLLGRGLSLSL